MAVAKGTKGLGEKNLGDGAADDEHPGNQRSLVRLDMIGDEREKQSTFVLSSSFKEYILKFTSCSCRNRPGCATNNYIV